MKALKISCFVLGLINLILLLTDAETIASLLEGKYTSHLFYVISTANAIIAARLAYVFNRSWLGWGFFTLFLGFILGLILPFLGDWDEDYDHSSSGSFYTGSSSYGS